MTRRQISLAHLTVLDTTPPELVAAAAAAGFRTIGIRLTATPSVGVPPYDILHEGPLLRETLRQLADHGVSLLCTDLRRVFRHASARRHARAHPRGAHGSAPSR